MRVCFLRSFPAVRVSSRRTACVCAALLASSAIAQPRIFNLGVLAGRSISSAHAISAHGSVVVGRCQNSGSVNLLAFLWTASTGMQSLGVLEGSDSEADGVSADGSVIVGWRSVVPSDGHDSRGYRWTAVEGVQSLPYLPAGDESGAAGVSADGAVVVGWVSSFDGESVHAHAFRGSPEGGMQNLGLLPGGTWSDALGISADGSVVVGVAESSVTAPECAFRWTSAGGMQDLGRVPGADQTAATAISADGSVITGYSSDEYSYETFVHTFRWTSGGGMQDLGTIAESHFSQGLGINADGSVIVGTAMLDPSSLFRATVWTAALGMVDLNAYLPTLGLDLTGWTLTTATAVSGDGAAIAGNGVFNGLTRAFLVSGLSFATPCPADLTRDGLVDDADFQVFVAAYNILDCADPSMPAGCPADFNNDGVVDDADFVIFVPAYNALVCS